MTTQIKMRGVYNTRSLLPIVSFEVVVNGDLTGFYRHDHLVEGVPELEGEFGVAPTSSIGYHFIDALADTATSCILLVRGDHEGDQFRVTLGGITKDFPAMSAPVTIHDALHSFSILGEPFGLVVGEYYPGDLVLEDITP